MIFGCYFDLIIIKNSPRFFLGYKTIFRRNFPTTKKKIFSLPQYRTNTTRKRILNKPFQLLRVSLVNWLNPRRARVITIFEFPFLRAARVFIEIYSGCAQFFQRSKPPIGKGKNGNSREKKNKFCRPCGNVEEIVSFGKIGTKLGCGIFRYWDSTWHENCHCALKFQLSSIFYKK